MPFWPASSKLDLGIQNNAWGVLFDKVKVLRFSSLNCNPSGSADK